LGEEMKVLVCGSAGCIGSNLMRYVLYRSKEFEFVGCDKLIIPVDYKKVYHHKNNKFYIGDVCDKDFLERLVYVEKPDVIVSGLFYHRNSPGTEYVSMIQAATNLSLMHIPVIQVGPPVDTDYDNMGLFKAVKNIIVNSRLSQNTYIEIPNVFGPRQRPACHLYTLLEDMLYNGSGYMYAQEELQSWVYVEDVASFIWYVIEEKKTGHIRMPALGQMSELEIANIINDMYGGKYKISKNQPDSFRLVEYGKPSKTKWVPDSESLKESLVKTIRWYDANRWAFQMYQEG
jgi:nucleoside-diphosphate-sugar epimerase